MFRPLLPLVAAISTLIGAAGLCAAQSVSNPAVIDQLSIPASPTRTPRRARPWPDAATIAAQNLELRIQEAEDAAFAAALLEALLNNRIAPSNNPLIFIPQPPAVFSSYLTEQAPGAPPQLVALRPLARPVAEKPVVPPTVAHLPAQVTPLKKRPAEAAPDCAANSLSWSPACPAIVGLADRADDAEVKTLDDGIYVRN